MGSQENSRSQESTSQSEEMLHRISYIITRSSSSTTVSSVHKEQAIMPINGIVFDLDGTLTIPVLNFKELRKKLGCPPLPVDILEFVRSKPENEKARLLKVVQDFEDEGNRNMVLQPGVHKLLKFLTDNGIKRALLTRNERPCVNTFLEKLGDPSEYGGPFSHLLTRDFTPSKPHPAPIHHICKEWGIKPCNAVMVGDHFHDINCGKKAGTVTILLNNPKNGACKESADFNVNSLEDMISLLKNNSMVVQREIPLPAHVHAQEGTEKHQ
ncbi:uncharacterized hydrolase YOR131C-like [Actinia tenebrosa]|uniref:Uncharacterized hydrolase YOR131C-like n=1 Tax=Actinia tenebrosa TaxID=6105 RepID=A0A6P8JBV3_ACTTE|nr:uncharacterized hydrolase YOR131C-like [Actinia tenebrosa]